MGMIVYGWLFLSALFYGVMPAQAEDVTSPSLTMQQDAQQLEADASYQNSLAYFRAYPLAERGYVLIQQERFDEALPLFRRAVELLPEHTGYRMQLVYLLMQQKNTAEAAQVVKEGLRVTENHPDLLAIQATLLQQAAPAPPPTIAEAAPVESPPQPVDTTEIVASPTLSAPPATGNYCDNVSAITDRTPMQNVEAGYCALNARNTAQAMRYFQAASTSQDAKAARMAAKQLAYLYDASGKHRQAVQAWRAVLSHQRDEMAVLMLARSLRLSGQWEEAQTLFSSVQADALNENEKRLYAAEGLTIAEHQQNDEQAIAMGEILLALQPTASAHYYQAVRLQRLERHERALHHLEEANRLEPDNRLFQVSLAYAYRNGGENAKAIPLFAAALAQEADMKLREDYAYALKHQSRRTQAAEQFRLILPSVEDLDKAYRMRRDIQQLEDRWTHVASITYRDGVSFPTGAGALGIGSRNLKESTLQYGLESVYAPASWQKYRRRVNLYGQLFTSAENGKLRHNGHSTQGVFGIRATPLADTDWFLYTARLIGAGDDALDDWQLRSTYGYTQGFDYDPNRTQWNYIFLATDASYLLDAEQRFASAEGRWGRSFRHGSGHWVWTPHVVSAISHQKAEHGSSENSSELGLGLSVKYWFDETSARAPRGSAELLLQWREPIGGNSDHEGGPFLRLVLQY